MAYGCLQEEEALVGRLQEERVHIRMRAVVLARFAYRHKQEGVVLDGNCCCNIDDQYTEKPGPAALACTAIPCPGSPPHGTGVAQSELSSKVARHSSGSCSDSRTRRHLA